MKTKEEIIPHLNALIAEEFEIDEAIIQPEASIFETLELDSISLIDLVSLVRTNYGIRIPNEALPQIKTFNDLYDYVVGQQTN